MHTTTNGKFLSSMEMKTFIADRPEAAEQNINEWLKDSQANVHHITQSQSEKNGRFVFVISIFYTAK